MTCVRKQTHVQRALSERAAQFSKQRPLRRSAQALHATDRQTVRFRTALSPVGASFDLEGLQCFR